MSAYEDGYTVSIKKSSSCHQHICELAVTALRQKTIPTEVYRLAIHYVSLNPLNNTLTLLEFLYTPLDFEKTYNRLKILNSIATTLGCKDIWIISSHFLRHIPPGGADQFTSRQIKTLTIHYPYLWYVMQRWHFNVQHPPEEVWRLLHELQDRADKVIINIRSNHIQEVVNTLFLCW